jgi:hypothetical protein
LGGGIRDNEIRVAAPHHPAFCDSGRRWHGLAFLDRADVAKQPGIAATGSADHDRIAIRCALHREVVSDGFHVTVADNRDVTGQGGANLGDGGKAHRPCKSLRSRAPVNGDERCPGIDHSACEASGIE